MEYFNQLPEDKQLEIISTISSDNGFYIGPRDVKIMTYIKNEMGVLLN